ncbi:Beta-monoglucosyldiacylglycerol synthase [Roseovarius sp. THAF27]|uniref:glycosyltransferase n=1 Tax=unclassified Roseovarius TaxID=2614913 RepID=UPI001267F157|nr:MULTISPECIES: glycosyltransferase [unclassified Roseovarius]QFT81573.1 Beta-monoglucosyldiacylglycerol synthase [Roseovarius sp. THAF27]QFT99292.1 Beta-monoglucosyldiacylglycerol synthase [Roseovarius sp. THAF8]
MGISELRQTYPFQDAADVDAAGVDSDLVRQGVLNVRDAILARQMRRHCDAGMDRILVAEGLVTRGDLLNAHARRFRSRQVDAAEIAALDPIAVPLAPRILLRYAFFPVTDRDGHPAIVCGDPEALAFARAHLPADLRRARVLIAPREVVQAHVADHFDEILTDAAQARVPLAESCRSWAHSHVGRLVWVLAGLTALIVATLFFAKAILAVLMGWAAFTLVVSAMTKLLAFVARLAEGPVATVVPAVEDKTPLPRVSVLVPLFRETEMVHALVARLSQLTYPKCLLDVVLVLEEEDAMTQATLAQIDLPSWIRMVVVPDGQPRTKPRAMNFALDFCEGDIIGIFDAEDAPEPDQITRVARHFQQAPPEVACLQGILDYYNPRQNWLARCFTIEYATWFRTILPGMARLGFAIPLGGTTLYFRRDALEALGGWDAHNVTEDADLGFRLARHGFRTEMVATVTEEEANCRTWAWIKQRSRWLKGYMTTYLVHMRRPGLLYRQLGAWKFWGFQAHFVTALSQVVLAPFLWSFWLVFLGLPHPLDPLMSRTVLVAFGALLLAIEVLNLTIYMASVTGPKHRHLLAWVPTMHFYLPLGAVAAYKALYELVLKPFFWDKTQHGLSLAVAPPPATRSASDQRIQFP